MFLKKQFILLNFQVCILFCRIQKYYFAILIIISGIVTGCSTEKNTLVTRSYHNLTSHYNIFFNGTESYKKGIRQAQESFVDDYTQILPIFTYNDPGIAQNIASDMDRTIKKATKVITLHSITAKPEYKNGPQTKKQKEFFARNEYNKWVDNNYLIMGKAYLYRLEFQLAIETFKFILTKYAYEDIIYETQLLLANAYNATKEYKESQKILDILTGEEKFPGKLKDQLYATVADLYMKREAYDEAIKPLTIALDHVKKKKTRIRYTFILGQLHQQAGNMEEASRYYQEVIKMNPSYEMSFNARINRASVFVQGADRSRDIRAELNKMLKDEKNKEYKDQIYYALGNIHYREGKTEEAISYYKLSSEASISNIKQKTKSCLTLAEIFYDRKDYESAKLYYDSAKVSLTSEYAGYADIMVKSKSLSQLVENLTVVHFEDSVQRLAGMSETERIAVIDSIIEQVKREENQTRVTEMQQMQDAQFNRIMLSENSRSGYQVNTAGGKWYFYNDAAKSFGQPEFRMKWGDRKLEDNWRRNNKSQITFEEAEAETNAGDTTTEIKKQILSNKTREYYLQNIPFTDSLMKISNERIKESLFNAGNIYKNDLKDYHEAVNVFRNLLDRYPGNDRALPAYYNLYILFNQLNEPALSDSYKDSIVMEFPDSPTAQLLTNPGYIDELIEKENEVNRFYEDTYLKFQQGNYYQVIRDADYACEKYKDSDLIPRFLFLKVLSIGQTQDIMIFSRALDSLANAYSSHEVAQRADEILDFIKMSDPEIKLETEKKEAEEIYIHDTTGTYFFGMIINKNIDVNQFVFEVINFNLDIYPNKTFDVVNENLSENQRLVLVKTFRDMERAWEYYDQVATGQKIVSLLEGTEYSRFIISPVNSETLIRDKIGNKYLLFFDKYYRHTRKNASSEIPKNLN